MFEMRSKIDQKTINTIREQEREKIEKELQELIARKDQSDYTKKGAYPRLQFINKYFLYGGLTHHYDEGKMGKSMDELEKVLMNQFECDPKWPICLFDFTYKNRIPTYLVFKVQQPLTELVIENYWTESYQK